MSENVRSNATWGLCSQCGAPLHKAFVKNRDHPDFGKSFAGCMAHGWAYEIVFNPGDEVVFLENVPNKVWAGSRARLRYPLPEHVEAPYMWEVRYTHITDPESKHNVNATAPEALGSRTTGYWVARVVPELTSMENADKWLEHR